MRARPRIAVAAACTFAWLGGAAFAASLLYALYFYFIRLERTVTSHDADLWTSLATNLGLFGLFALHHSVAARESVKRYLVRIVPPELERATYVWISSLLFYLVCRLWAPTPGPAIYQGRGAFAWLLVAVQVGGVWLIARAARVLDSLELAGIRQAMGSARESRFMPIGPYRWIRHPVYLGWILMVFATPHMTPGRMSFAAISSAYLLIAIRWEERSLLGTFGERYRAYARQVPWKLIPHVY